MYEQTILETFELLHSLGITANHRGYFYTAYGVSLVKEQPERLLLVTKWLYPDIAKQYKTTWQCVERNIRTVITLAWERKPEVLAALAGYPLEKKPSVGEFLGILICGLAGKRAA